MPATLEQALAWIAFVVVVGMVFCGILYFAARAGWVTINMPFNLGSVHRPGPPKTTDEIKAETDARVAGLSRDRKQLLTAVSGTAEVAEGLVSMAENATDFDAARRWFGLVCDQLAGALQKGPGDIYRVSMWADVPDRPAEFIMVGQTYFDPNDPALEHLDKATTIAGGAFRDKTGEYYCRDVAKDRKYKPRTRGKKPQYASIFAVALGRREKRWGVLTVDSRRISGFNEADLAIVRSFARIAAAGSALYQRLVGSGPTEH